MQGSDWPKDFLYSWGHLVALTAWGMAQLACCGMIRLHRGKEVQCGCHVSGSGTKCRWLGQPGRGGEEEPESLQETDRRAGKNAVWTEARGPKGALSAEAFGNFALFPPKETFVSF